MRKAWSASPGLLAAACALVLCVWFAQPRREPTFKDSSLREWAADLGRDPVSAKRRLGEGGATAVPVLVALLADGDGLIASCAAEVLCQIAPDAPEAIPPLLAARKHASLGVRCWVVRTLEQVKPADEEIIAAMSDALQDSSPAMRSMAARALGNAGPAARPALPALQQALQDRNQIVRTAAAGAIFRLDTGQSRALDLLIHDLDADAAHDVRLTALRTLESLGPLAANALNDVRTLLNDPNPAVREAATQAIKQISKPAAAVGAEDPNQQPSDARRRTPARTSGR